MTLCERCIQVISLGKMRYAKALKKQHQYARLLLDEIGRGAPSSNSANKLLLVEHTPVYTVGLRHKGYDSETADKLRALGADYEVTNRGGLITFHGPGQLVAYPIIYLKHFNIGMRRYIEQLEGVTIGMCKQFGFNATTSPDTGVWVGDDKIAAIGVHGSRYVTTHGIAINCDTDLAWFDHIVACGLPDKGVTSLTEHAGRRITVSEAARSFLKEFADTFGCKLIGDLSFDPQPDDIDGLS